MPRISAVLSAKCIRSAKAAALLFAAMAAPLVSRPAQAAPQTSYDDAIKQLASQLADSLAASGKKAVAVNAFTDLDGDVTELGRFLAGDLSDALSSQAKGFLVIDRTQAKGSAAQSSSVDAFVIGSLTTSTDHVRLSAKVLDASNSAILGAANVDIPRTKDVDDLLARAPGPRGAPAASNAQPSSIPAAQANQAPAPAAAPPGKSRISLKPAKNPGGSATPSLTGMGSVATPDYKIIATSVDRTGNNETVALEFDAVSANTVQLAMTSNQTYLTDETGVRWSLAHADTAGIFNAHAGFWRPVVLARGGKIETVLTFSPQGPATGTKFTLTISEFRPKWNRVVAIEGLK